ncbi:hypothetical protein [Agromyces arachidis]|uniref:hypothetical protein n=1 Tax=Agromyces arachidis TaxID=766966 RepID=UPI004055B226
MDEPGDDERRSAGALASRAVGEHGLSRSIGPVPSIASDPSGAEGVPSTRDGDQQRGRWWRERPPRGLSRFGRAVWWAGHVQLPLALALLLTCLPIFVANATLPRFAGAAWLGLAMSAPFAVSGLMLRSSSEWQVYREGPAGSGAITRTVALVATVAGIAVLSIALTIFAGYLLFFMMAAIAQMT